MTTTFCFDVSIDKSNSQLTTPIRAFTGGSGSLTTYIPVPTGNLQWIDKCEEAGYLAVTIAKANLTLQNLNAFASADCVGALAIQLVNYRRWYPVKRFIYLEGTQGTCTITLQVERPGVIRDLNS